MQDRRRRSFGVQIRDGLLHRRYVPFCDGAEHAVETCARSRTLYISGLNGFEEDGVTMPEWFEDQAELVWRRLARTLAAAGMTYADLVSLRFYLADAADDPANVAILRRHLKDHRCARTVVCAQLLDPAWRIEIEAVAARSD